MVASRVLGPAALALFLALLGLCRCASGGPMPEATGTGTAAADASAPAPAPTPAPDSAPAPAPDSAATPAETPAPVAATGPGTTGRVDFAAQVLPLLQQKCSPCHFQGGRMYGRLPFDQEGTIRVLGTQMFSRLRDPLDQELIRTYLEQR
jgi:hypothetical protein